MILYGASGHGKVVLDILTKCGIEPKYFVDSNTTLESFYGYKVVVDDTFIKNLQSPNDTVIITIGANELRLQISKTLNTKFGRAIHPSSQIGLECNFGEGTVIMAGTVINPSTNIGSHVIINTSASVDHDCNIADFAHISPNATLCGGVNIGEGTQVGAGAIIIPQVSVGAWSVIGAGATVVSDVPDYAVAIGTPARVVKFREVNL
jgi:sugar O-acyltransferase (sialic acid O-acetyltransferase NeuD family)